MPLAFDTADLPLLAAGASFCGSGGGGSPRILELMLQQQLRDVDRVVVHTPEELDPAMPCFAAAFAGSTMLLEERLPGLDVFTPLIDTAERWIGTRVEAVCSPEGGGMNALAPLLFTAERQLVDADLSGRAVPTLDRMSLYLDRVPGLFAVCSTGASGVSIVSSDRADDVDQIMRASIVQAGGVGAIVIAGFTVGDLIGHAITGHLRHCIEIGAALRDASEANSGIAAFRQLARRVGGSLIGHGRVLSSAQDFSDPHVHSTEIGGADGEVLRLVARSEYLAVLRDGRPVAASPDYIVAFDALSHELIEVTDLSLNRHVVIVVCPADDWWREQPDRARRVAPGSYDLHGLEPEW